MGGLVIELDHQLDRVSRRLTDRVRTELVRAAPKKTGELRRSITVKSQRRIDGIALIVGIRVVQAATTEFGARPHIIRPRKAKALRFIGRGGKVVFASIVHHPGNKPMPWIFPSLRNFDKWAQQELDRVG